MKLVEKTNSQTSTYFADIVQIQIKDIVFIDKSVIEYQSLIAGIKPDYEVIIIDSTKDGVAQISESLIAGRFKSVHIVCHGSEGSLQLGATQLNTDNLNFYAEQLQQWANVFTNDADILLYGCDVASKEGKKFVEQISRLTGANVAASTNKIGSAALGGNWDLDFSTGKIKATLAFQPEVMQAYNGVFNTPSFIINNPSPAAGERFGFSLASNGTSILIGAPKANGDRGEVYQVTNNGILQQTFTNPSIGTGELFGLSVATNGTDYIIGAPKLDVAVADVGRAYKFNANGSLQQTFDNSINNDDSEFGSAVAILSNGNFVIGAPEKGKITATDNAGEVRLFDSNGVIRQIINPTTGLIQDARFGFAVAAANNDILIGSPGFGTFTTTLNFGIGQAYRYNTAGTLLQTFTNPNPTTLDFFGLSVKSNSNGTRFLIGAPGEDSGGTDAGAVYLYDTTTATPTLLKTFINPDTSNLGFGSSLGFIGNDILIGAAGTFTVNGTTFTPVPGRGAVYLYDGDGASPTYKLENIFSNPGTGNDAFGGAITTVGSNQIAISAPYYDAGTNTDSGIAYIYEWNNVPANIVIGTSSNETFVATTKTDFFDGKDGSDSVSANIANLQQNDTINGGAGIDTFILSGGTSANTVTIDLSNLSNQVQGISGLLVSNFENFDFRNFAGTINLNGGTGNSSIIGGVGADSLSSGDGNNYLLGGAGNDSLNGGAGNDILDGGVDEDSLVGGDGNDIYYVDNVKDVVVEANINGGTDTIYASVNYTLGANLENLTLTVNAINATGNALDNTIKGNNADNSLVGGAGNDYLFGGAGNDSLNGGAGNDILDGGVGEDSLVGGDGNDIYYVDNVKDVVVEDNVSGGTDSIYASVDYTLGTNVENLTLTGNAINATGNALNNTIRGNNASNYLIGADGNDFLFGGDGNDSLDGGAGNDVLDGGVGEDSLVGGDGNDIYYVDNVKDVVVEDNVSGGTDSIYASVDYTLGTNVENLTLTGNAINATGNALNNTIRGNNASNYLIGADGNDYLSGDIGDDSLVGGDGNDSLLGGNDNDFLVGGAGNDYLLSGTGNDQFVYNLNSAFNSSAMGVDTIADFTLNSDKIVLYKNTFTAITSIAGNGFSVASEFIKVTTDAAAAISSAMIVYNSANGKLFYNDNGVLDGFGTGAQFATLTNRPSLSANDFLIQ